MKSCETVITKKYRGTPVLYIIMILTSIMDSAAIAANNHSSGARINANLAVAFQCYSRAKKHVQRNRCEKHAMMKSHGKVSRTGKLLLIKLLNGKIKQFKSEKPASGCYNGDGVMGEFRYLGMHESARMHLVEFEAYSGCHSYTDYLLINSRNGNINQFAIPHEVVWSKDFHFFAISPTIDGPLGSSVDEFNVNEPHIFIYQVSPDGVRQIFKKNFIRYQGYDELNNLILKWLSPSTIEVHFAFLPYLAKKTEDQYKSIPSGSRTLFARVQKEKGLWHVELISRIPQPDKQIIKGTLSDLQLKVRKLEKGGVHMLPKLANAIREVAKKHFNGGHFKQAMSQIRRAYKIHKNTLGIGDYEVAQDELLMAKIYLKSGNRRLAKKYLLSADRVARKRRGENNPVTQEINELDQ